MDSGILKAFSRLSSRTRLLIGIRSWGVVLLVNLWMGSDLSAQCTAVIGANINPIEGCDILTVQFNDLSSGAESRSWDFGDGSPTSVAQNPVHSYNTVWGDTSYTLTLSISCPSGEVSSATRTVKVFARPKVGFASDRTELCALTDSIHLLNSSSADSGNSYLWNFGDGTVSGDSDPWKTYSTPGTYDVELTVTNPHGCLQTLIKSDYFTAEPVPSTAFSVSANSVCHPAAVSFDNTTDTTGTSYRDWNWDFGDGSPFVNAFEVPPHTFGTPGTYTVKLGTKNSLGCYNYSTQRITVKRSPSAVFSANSPICLNESTVLNFTGIASDSADFNWDLDSGVPDADTGRVPNSVNWATAGNKTVSLTIDDDGCLNSYSGMVRVNPEPRVSLSSDAAMNTVCSGQELTVTASPSSYLMYEFYWNDDTVRNGQKNSFASDNFADGDRLTVKVTDVNGCNNPDPDTLVLRVHDAPLISLTGSSPGDTLCFGDSVTFIAGPDNLYSYSFYLDNVLVQEGPGNTYTSQDLTGEQKIYARASDSVCLSEISNVVSPPVRDRLSLPRVNCGSSNDNNIEYIWDTVPGALEYQVSIDGGAYQLPSSGKTGTSHILAGITPGESHELRVRAIDGSPCTSGAVSSPVTCSSVQCEAISLKMDAFRQVCEGEEVILRIEDLSADDYSISWNGEDPVTALSYPLSPGQSLAIPVEIVDSSQLGCTPWRNIFQISVIPVARALISSIPDNGEICENDGLTLVVDPPGFDTYGFYEGATLLQEGTANSIRVHDLSDGAGYHAVAAGSGCSQSTDTIRVTVHDQLPAPQVYPGPSTLNSVQFAWDSVPGAAGYLVIVGDGDLEYPSSGIEGLTHLVNGLEPGEAVSLSVMALGENICGNSEVSPPAVGFAEECDPISFSLERDHTLCYGDSVLLELEGLDPPNCLISWAGGMAATDRSTMIKPVSDTIIAVSATKIDQPACPPHVEYARIKVNDLPGMLTLASSAINDTICEGSPVGFIALPEGYDTYVFYDGYRKLQESSGNQYVTADWRSGHEITAAAVNNGCAGPESEPVVTVVREHLKVPQVNCGSSTDSSVTFTWDPIPGATGYRVSIEGGPYTVPSSGNAGLLHRVLGLNGGDPVSIRVIALGELPCGNSEPSEEQTCFAVNCNAFNYEMDPYRDICAGESESLSISGITTSSYAVAWNGGPQVADTNLVFSGAVDSVVSVSVFDLSQPACAPVTRRFEIEINPLPEVSILYGEELDTICQGERIEYRASVPGYDKYTFYNNNEIVQESDFHVYSLDKVMADQAIYVTAVQDACGYTSDTVHTKVLSLPELRLSSSREGPLCYEDAVDFTVSGGFQRYVLSDSLKVLIDSPLSRITMPVRSPFITAEAYNAFGCTRTSPDTIRFEILPLPELSISASADTICPGEPALITALPYDLAGYSLFNRDSSRVEHHDGSIFYTGRIWNDQDFLAVGTDANGCNSKPSNPVGIRVRPRPAARIQADAVGICRGDTAVLSIESDAAFPEASYAWSTGSNDTVIRVSPPSSGMFRLLADFGVCGSVQIDSIFMDVDTDLPPVAYAGEDMVICVYDSIQMEGSGGLSYAWSPGRYLSDSLISNPWVKIPETTSFTLTVKNSYCRDSDTITITADKCLEDLTAPIPEIITPNGDGLNDYWFIADIDYFEQNRVEIFNRWGNLVYSAGPYDNTWDGRSQRGDLLPDGTYYFIVDLGNGTECKTGYIIIHR